MDYKQKYEKAIERAKTVITLTSSDEAVGAAITIFPELNENKDEKIRKEIIRVFKGETSYTSREENEKYIAWLEKQGGKVDVLNDFLTEFERQISYLIASSINKEWEYTEGFVKHAANALLQYAKNELEKQGEKNPKFRIGDTIKKKSTGDIVTVSEIDLKNREYRLSNTGFIPFKYEHLWELVEQIPAWSEEDEKMLQDIISGLKAQIQLLYIHDEQGKAQMNNRIEWLKSIKPRWKPTKEQMEALEHFVRSIGESGYASPYDNNTKLIYSLLNDLKSL